MPEPNTEVLEQMIERARRGDWAQEARLKVMAADLIDKGEPLPVPLRSYITAAFREAFGPTAAEFDALFRRVQKLVHYCICFLSGGDGFSRDGLASDIAELLAFIRALPGKLGRSHPPGELRDYESTLIEFLVLLEQREVGFEHRPRNSWQNSINAVSARLDPDRDACGRGKKPARSGYSPRSIASHLKRARHL
jgi:hypothetical protein